MSVESVAASSVSFLSHLIEPALRSLAVAAVAGIVIVGLRMYGVKSRLAVWRIVLCAALAMPLLNYVLPPMPVSAQFLNAIPALAERLANQIATAGPSDSGVVEALPPSVDDKSVSSVTVAHFATNQIDLSRVRDSAESTPASEAPVRAARAKHGAVATANYRAHHAAGHLAAATAPALHFWNTWSVPTSLVVLYLALVACFVARMITGIFLGAHLNRKAHTIRDARAIARLNSCAEAAGVSRVPRLAESAALSVPVTFGVTKPSILVPVTWREWSDDEFSSVLFHEMSHVARRDALAERLSLVHRAIFWFSPLSWWLDRKLAQLAEEASDEAALASGIDRTRYAETLLGFFRALETAPGRVWWQGVSMAAAGQAEKRVDRILSWKGDSGMTLKKPAIVAAVCFAIPLVALASAITPRFERTHIIQQAAQAPAAPQAQSTRPAAPTPAAPAPSADPAPSHVTVLAVPAPEAAPKLDVADAEAPVVMVDPHVKVVPLVKVDPHVTVDAKTHVMVITKPGAPPVVVPLAHDIVVAPLAPMPGVAPSAMPNVAPKVFAMAPVGGISGGVYTLGPTRAVQDKQVTVTDYGHAGDQLVVVSGDTSFVMINPGRHSATTIADDVADDLRQKYGDNFIWFRQNGKDYLITDPQTIQRVKATHDAMEALDKKQEELGQQQEAIGEQQAAIGQLMSGTSVNIPDLSAQMKAIDDEMKSLNSDANRKAMAEAQASLDAAIAKLDVNSPQMAETLAKLQAQSEALKSDEMAERMSQMQERLGELQEKLSEAQSGNGDRQEKLSKLESELGKKEEALGEQESKLGAQQEAAAKEAERQVRQILNDAIAKGVAKPQ